MNYTVVIYSYACISSQQQLVTYVHTHEIATLLNFGCSCSTPKYHEKIQGAVTALIASKCVAATPSRCSATPNRCSTFLNTLKLQFSTPLRLPQHPIMECNGCTSYCRCCYNTAFSSKPIKGHHSTLLWSAVDALFKGMLLQHCFLVNAP